MSDNLNIQSEIFKLLNSEYPEFKRKINISDYVTPMVSNSTIQMNKRNNSNLLYFKLNNGISGNIKINITGFNTDSYKVYDIYGEEVVTLTSGYYDALMCEGYFVLLNKEGLSESTLSNYNLIQEVINNIISNDENTIVDGKFIGILKNSVTEDKLSPLLRKKINENKETSEIVLTTNNSQLEIYNYLNTSNKSIRFSPGIYTLNGNNLPSKTININNPIRISGENVTINMEGGLQLVINSPNVSMDGLKLIVRNHGSLSGNEACLVIKRNNVSIDKCYLEGTMYYHGIFIGDSLIGNCDDISITNTTLKNFGYGVLKQFLNKCTAHRLRIDNCYFYNMLRGDAIELNLRYDIGYVITNNYIDGVASGNITNAGIGIGIAGGTYGGDKLDQTRDGFILNNVIKNVERCAIHLEACNKFTIRDNNLSNTGDGIGLEIFGSTEITMEDNYIEGFNRGILDDIGALSGIGYIISTDNNIIKNNFVNNCNSGIQIGAVGDNKSQFVLDNLVKNCNTGIYVYGKAIFDISNNILDDCKIAMNINYEPTPKASIFSTKNRYIKINNNTTRIKGLDCDNYNNVLTLVNFDKFEFENNNFKLGNYVRKNKLYNSTDDILYYVKGDEISSVINGVITKQIVTNNGFKTKINTNYYFTAISGNDYFKVTAVGDPKNKFTNGQTIQLTGAGTGGTNLTVVILDMYVSNSEYRVRISDTIKTTVPNSALFNIIETATFKEISEITQSEIDDINYELSELSNQVAEYIAIAENVIEVGSGKQFTNVTDAINSITDNSKSNRYKLKVYPGTYNERIILKDYVGVEGINRNTVIFEMNRPDDTPNNKVTDESMVELHYDGSYIRNITVKGRNFRYMIHAEFSNKSNASVEVDNCYVQHLGNAEVFTWKLPHAVGAGLGVSNTTMSYKNSTFIGGVNGRGILIHDNANPTASSSVNIETSYIMSEGGTVYEGLNIDNYSVYSGNIPWYVNLNNNIIQIGVAVTGSGNNRAIIRGGGNSMSRYYTTEGNWVDSDSGLYLKNTSGSTILRGSAVAMSDSERGFSSRFNGTNYDTYNRFAGFAIRDIPNGEYGWVVRRGTISMLFGGDANFTNQVMFSTDGTVIAYNQNTSGRRLPIGELIQPTASSGQVRRVLINEANLYTAIPNNVLTRGGTLVEYAWNGTPLNVPGFKGQMARDTITGNIYIAIGTSSTSDWIRINTQ